MVAAERAWAADGPTREARNEAFAAALLIDDFEGALEGSNVNVVRSVVDLVRVNRTYQALTRMIDGYKEVENRAARSLGGPK